MLALEADDVLPHRPRRVLVAGTSGSGKSTLAAQIGHLLDLPYVEIDSLYHGPGWTRRPSFEADVDAFSRSPGWVTEWQYRSVRELLVQRADLLVWLDLPRRTVMRRVIGRTVRRRWARQELWNGNVEPPLWRILVEQDQIIRWAWRTHPKTAARVLDARRRFPDLAVVRLRAPAEVRRWLDVALRDSTGDQR